MLTLKNATGNLFTFAVCNEMSIADLVKDEKVEELHRVILNGRDKFLAYTHLTTAWNLCCTDGLTVWRREVDGEELETLKDLSKMTSSEAFLAKIRTGFNTGDVSVAMIGTKVTLTVGKGPSALEFDLYETKAAEKKAEMQSVLFRLAEVATSLEIDLAKANRTIETLKAQKGGGGGGAAFMDLGPKRGLNPAKVKPTKAGMSVLNPTSKKRKAAHGVVFD